MTASGNSARAQKLCQESPGFNLSEGLGIALLSYSSSSKFQERRLTRPRLRRVLYLLFLRELPGRPDPCDAGLIRLAQSFPWAR
jgi:hypothetical protein